MRVVMKNPSPEDDGGYWRVSLFSESHEHETWVRAKKPTNLTQAQLPPPARRSLC